jgi:hypothetical protein
MKSLNIPSEWPANCYKPILRHTVNKGTLQRANRFVQYSSRGLLGCDALSVVVGYHKTRIIQYYFTISVYCKGLERDIPMEFESLNTQDFSQHFSLHYYRVPYIFPIILVFMNNCYRSSYIFQITLFLASKCHPVPHISPIILVLLYSFYRVPYFLVLVNDSYPVS